jgi:hypothetical protein
MCISLVIDYECEVIIVMTHCRITHDTLQKYSWHISEIRMIHEITNKYMYITQGIKIRLIEDLPYYLFNISGMCHVYFPCYRLWMWSNQRSCYSTVPLSTNNPQLNFFILQKYSWHIAKNIHNTLQKYWWHIAEILMTHDCRHIHDTLQKYSWNIAKIFMTYYKNTHDMSISAMCYE